MPGIGSTVAVCKISFLVILDNPAHENTIDNLSNMLQSLVRFLKHICYKKSNK